MPNVPGWRGDAERHRQVAQRTPKEQARLEDILLRVAQGESVRALAQEYGISKQAIYVMLKQASQPTPTELERLVARLIESPEQD